MRPLGLIAEDEPLLAAALKAELARAWPELHIHAVVGDGASAVAAALQARPDVLFLDIRMPGQGGLEAAAELADRWDDLPGGAPARPFPALVFVTAYDQYAVQAFDAQALDYLLKPVQAARLLKTVERLRLRMADRASPPAGVTPQGASGDGALDTTMAQLRALLASVGQAVPAAAAAPSPAAETLRMLQVGVGTTIRMVPVDEVLFFEAADKYVRVLTAEHEYLVRTALRELLPQLDARHFWQVHRGTVVRASAITEVTRDEAGKLWLRLQHRSEKLAVSRLYAHLFKAM